MVPKSVTVPVAVALRTEVKDVGASPTPYSSSQVKAPERERSRARPLIGTLGPVTGAYQSGEAMFASGGSLPSCAAATAAPRSTRP